MEKELTSCWKTKGAWVSTSSQPYNEQVMEGHLWGFKMPHPLPPTHVPHPTHTHTHQLLGSKCLHTGAVIEKEDRIKERILPARISSACLDVEQQKKVKEPGCEVAGNDSNKLSLRAEGGESNGNPFQYSCLENPMDGGAWWAAVHGVAKSWTWLSDFTFTFHFHALEKEMATHSSVLAWRIAGMEEPGGLLSMTSHRVEHDWSDLAAAEAAEQEGKGFRVLGMMLVIPVSLSRLPDGGTQPAEARQIQKISEVYLFHLLQYN